MNFRTLCIEITKREDARKGDVNIAQVRTVARHLFEILEEESWNYSPDTLSKEQCYDSGLFDCLQILKYYRKSRKSQKGKGNE